MAGQGQQQQLRAYCSGSCGAGHQGDVGAGKRQQSLAGATITLSRRRLPERGAVPQTTTQCQRKVSQMTVRSGPVTMTNLSLLPLTLQIHWLPIGHTRTLSVPYIVNKDLSINHQHSQSDISADGTHVKARHEALQKLATFFHSPKPVEPAASSPDPETSPVAVKEEEVLVPEASSTQEIDFDPNVMLILPPPDLYADLTLE
ncbi:uncharacterized protein LOC115006881 [Cottoperca gobio]|uniref:Uncharacterized protein LOC115006881 n=1 Tax=Cottoperca gobio TaxID=56716 RepID=A0A6J2PIZ6_COTGO|nr:uncharacterized protein LOC115006881 [Cottoperca gobio]XP_029285340.1 uncharacterized protein LOC115006881 [Cottoperca gobio]